MVPHQLCVCICLNCVWLLVPPIHAHSLNRSIAHSLSWWNNDSRSIWLRSKTNSHFAVRIKSPKQCWSMSKTKKKHPEEVHLFIQYNMNYLWIGDAFFFFAFIFFLCIVRRPISDATTIYSFLFSSVSFLCHSHLHTQYENCAHIQTATHTKTFKLNEIIEERGSESIE